jgi:hypothetical protein
MNSKDRCEKQLAAAVIAETAGGGATGATGTVREYIYLPEAEIAPTRADAVWASGAQGGISRTRVDRPIAVGDGGSFAGPPAAGHLSARGGNRADDAVTNKGGSPDCGGRRRLFFWPASGRTAQHRRRIMSTSTTSTARVVPEARAFSTT